MVLSKRLYVIPIDKLIEPSYPVPYENDDHDVVIVRLPESMSVQQWSGGGGTGWWTKDYGKRRRQRQSGDGMNLEERCWLRSKIARAFESSRWWCMRWSPFLFVCGITLLNAIPSSSYSVIRQVVELLLYRWRRASQQHSSRSRGVLALGT